MDSETEVVAVGSGDQLSSKGDDEVSNMKAMHPEGDLPSRKVNGHVNGHGDDEFTPSLAHEKSANLEKEIGTTENTTENSKGEALEERAPPHGELQKTQSELEGVHVEQEKLKALESAAPFPGKELAHYRDEARNARIESEKTKQECAVLKERVTMLEQNLTAADLKIRDAEEILSAQAKAHQDELTRKGGEEQTFLKLLDDAKQELESVQGKVKELESELSVASNRAEGYHKELNDQVIIANEYLEQSRRSKAVAEAAETNLFEVQEKMKTLQEELAGLKDRILEGDQLSHLLEETKLHATKVEEELGEARARIIQLEKENTDEKDQIKELVLRLTTKEEELKTQIDNLKLAEDDTLKVREQVASLENMLRNAETMSTTKDETIASLQEELDSLKAKSLELQQHAEEGAKQLEIKYQEQLVATEEKYENANKSISELNAKLIELQDALATSESERETAKKRVNELENNLESISENKVKIEEEVSELQGKLTLKEETVSKLENSLKESEERAGKANQQILELESMSKMFEENLKIGKESIENLQLQLTASKSNEETLTKCLEEAKEKRQLEIHEKLNLEQKITELQESLGAAQSEAEKLKKKLEDLEVNVQGLENERLQLEGRLKDFEEKHSRYENSLQGSRARNLELEDLIIEHKSKADDSVSRIGTLEATLADTNNQKAQLETKLSEAQETILALENAAKEVSTHLVELQDSGKISAARAIELETAFADANRREKALLERLESTEGLLTESQTKIDSAAKRVDELELSVANIRDELKTALDRGRALVEDKSLLEEKVAKLDSDITNLEAEKQIKIDAAMNTVEELKSSIEATEKNLKCAMEKENRLTEEKSLLESNIEKLQAQITELEGTVLAGKSMVASLEQSVEKYKAGLQDSQAHNIGLETKSKEAEEKYLVFEKKANDISGQLESFAKESSAKIYELEVRLRHKEEDEKHLIEEKRLLEEKVMELEAQISNHVANITQTKSRIDLLEPLVESMKTDLQRAADSEEKLKEELSSQRASNHTFAEQLSQLQSEKDGIISQLDNSQKEFAELTEKLSEEKKQLQSQIGKLMQEKDGLTEELVKKANELNAKFEEMERLTNQLQQSLSKEASLVAEVGGLKLQLVGVLHNQQKHVEELAYITTEEHKAQVEQLLAASVQHVNKLAEAEKQLSETKLEISKVQKAYNEQEIRYKELDAKMEKSELVTQQPSGATKSRDIDVDAQYQSPGKVRNRKKKGVSGEAESSELVSKMKGNNNGKQTHVATHNPNQFLVHVVLAMVSLTAGFWLARKIYL